MILLKKLFNQKQGKSLSLLWCVLWLAPLCILFANPVNAQEVVLYDASGQFVGYLDPTYDSIYLSSGEPVAYINKTTGAIYGYDGKFLGWYSDGVVRDASGFIIGFSEPNAPKTVVLSKPSDIRFVRKPLPTPVQTQVVVERPIFSNELSPTPFSKVYVYPAGAEPVR
jgi:hypothetical protein